MKLVRYIISGGTAALVSLGLLYFFTDVVGIWYLLSSTLAFVFAFVVSFLLQKLWTFKDGDIHDTARQVLLYFLTAVIGLSANALFMYTFVDIFGVWYLFAQILSSGITAVITFFVYGNVIFNRAQKGRILIATGLYPPEIGGPATYTKMLEEELPKRGFSVYVLPFSAVRRLPKIIRHLAYFLLLCFQGVEVETFYALDPVSVGLPAFFAAKLLRKKFLLRVAGDYAWEQFQVQSVKRKTQNAEGVFVTLEEFQEKKFDFVTEARRWIERFVARRAKLVVVPSEYLKKIIMMWGGPASRLRVIYSTPDSVSVSCKKEEARKKLGIDGAIIFSAGRLVPWKGFDALIEVIRELKREIPDIKLYIAGEGPQQKNLEFRIMNYELSGAVFLLGKLDHGRLLEYICAADVFVLNTGYEGFSHQLLEVMALGTPVVSTNVGGNPELITNQKEGILVSYNDKKGLEEAVRAVLRDDTLRFSLIQNAREKVKMFAKEKMIEKFTQLLDEREQ